MSEETQSIELQISLSEYPELFDLTAAFAAVGNMFDRFIATNHPALRGEARLLVKEIRQGSTIIELIPAIPPLIASLDAVLIVDDFMTRFGGLLRTLVHGEAPSELTNADAKSFLDTVRLIAKDTKGSVTLSSAKYRDGKADKSINFEFTTPQAKIAKQVLEQKIIENEEPILEKFENKLLVFWQSNRSLPKTGKPSGEKATIESVYAKPLAITYDSDLAKERIKYETTEDERNIFRKGFYVDGFVERFNGRPVALRIIAVRHVIDLPDDE